MEPSVKSESFDEQMEEESLTSSARGGMRRQSGSKSIASRSSSIAQEPILLVKVLSATGLPSIEGMQANYSVSLEVLHRRERTSFVRGTTSPEWNKILQFPSSAIGDSEYVTAFITHHAVDSAMDQDVGVALIPLVDTLGSIGEWQEYTCDIVPTAEFRGPNTFQGTLSVEMTLTQEYEDPAIVSDVLRALESNEPNTIRVFIIEAINVKCNRPFILLRLNDELVGESKPLNLAESRNPRPSCSLQYEADVTNFDPNAVLGVVLRDKSRIGSTMIGQIRLSMSEIALAGEEGLSDIYPLLGRDWATDEDLGSIRIKVQWLYTEQRSSGVKAKRRSGVLPLKGWGRRKPSDASDVSDVEVGELGGEREDETLKQMAQQEREEQTRSEMIQDRLSNLKHGEYNLLVHIIECEDLKGENFEGTSDPIVTVECLDKQQHTHTISGVTSCVFDERLFFTFPDLGVDQLSEATILVNVYDANTFLRDKLIGGTAVDLLTVYSMDNHEIYRQWFPLVDNQDEGDKGIQGYIRVSMVLLGPGDKPKVHREEEELESSALSDTNFQSVSRATLSLVPTLKQDLHFLVITILKLENLASRPHLGGHGLNVYVSASFAGTVNFRSTSHELKGRSDDHGVWMMEQVFLPVMEPTMTHRIRLKLCDKEKLGGEVVLGHMYFDFKSLERISTPRTFLKRKAHWVGKEPAQWVNVYGAPHDKPSGKASTLMTQYPSLASTYKGRALIGMYIEERPDSKLSNRPAKRLFEIEEVEKLLPPTMPYVLRVALFEGFFHSGKGIVGVSLKVTVSIGLHLVEFGSQPLRQSIATWDQLEQTAVIELPAAASQLPDIFVHLWRSSSVDLGGGIPISFVRINASEIIDRQLRRKPMWYELQADKAHGALSSEMHAGTLLIDLGLGSPELAAEREWPIPRVLVQNREPCCLRVFVYQARNLPAGDENGLVDPYVKVRFMGQRHKTSVQKETRSPLYYEVLEFHDVVPVNLLFAGECVLEVWDRDQVSRNTKVCMRRFNLNDQAVSKITLPHDSGVLSPETPQWYKLFDPSGQQVDGFGDILLSFQLIWKPSVKTLIPQYPRLEPETAKWYLEVICVGVRDLTPFTLGHAMSPRVSFEMVFSGERFSFHTPAGKGANANFCYREVKEVLLPIDVLYAPQMTIRVYDSRIGALTRGLVGVGNVDIGSKIPGTPGFIPLRQRLVRQQSAFSSESDNASKKQIQGASEAKGKESVDPGTGAFPTSTQLPDIEAADEHDLKSTQTAPAKQPWIDLLYTSVNFSTVGGGVDDGIDELGISLPTTWAENDFTKGRDYWINNGGQELEDLLEHSPFETYHLYKGQQVKQRGIVRDRRVSYQTVGKLKAIIAVTKHKPHANHSAHIDLRLLRVPQTVVIRLYVIKGINLQPKDANGLSDPYLRVILGKDKQGNKEDAILKEINPEFFRCFELVTTMPGPSQLRIQTWDYDRFKLDDLIGETIIDLEDRWFHQGWHTLDAAGTHPAKYGKIKPLEYRSLYQPKSKNPQGQLLLWVDMLTYSQAKTIERQIIAPPQQLKVEVRVICWKCQDVPAFDSFEGLNDLYAKFWFENQPKIRKNTDTHWRAKHGRGSWNYRLKFEVTLPLRSPELSRLRFQLWDKDVLKWNDFIAEGTIELYRWFMLCYRDRRSVKPFLEIQEAYQRKKAQMVKRPENMDEEMKENDSELDAEDDHDRIPLLRQPVDATQNVQESGMDETSQFIEQVKLFFGIADLPEDARWFKMTRHDRKKKSLLSMGEIALSVEILPLSMALASPVGEGRGEPNVNPYLPKPVDRISFSFNPFSMVYQLCGSRGSAKIVCCCCCVFCLVVFLFVGQYATSITSVVSWFQ